MAKRILPVIATLLLSSTLQSAFAQSAKPGSLSAVDYAFVGQTFLGNQFQVDTGRLGADRAGGPKVKDYAKEMVPSHEQVEQKLVAILGRKGVEPPPTSLLASSYTAMKEALSAEKGSNFDHEYIRQQLNYQTGNDALYRWEIASGSDPDLKAFAKEVLVKIDEHFDMIKTLAREQKVQ